jgi:hypothetical protein
LHARGAHFQSNSDLNPASGGSSSRNKTFTRPGKSALSAANNNLEGNNESPPPPDFPQIKSTRPPSRRAITIA